MLEQKYNHKISEKKWQETWRETEVYKWKNDKPKSETFVIDTPPPTVSGVLHMGHVFSYTQADFIARFQRMAGKDVFYPMGFDDNGLPTERLVEKVKKIRGNQMKREDFIKECQSVVDEAEKEFEALFNSIALSVDWDQKYQTISQESQKISQASFVDLWQKNHVERKFEPVLWDCVDQTALSQADLIDKELPSAMNEIEFGTENGQKIIIMTTRPELLAACVAVMVHPDDKRYKEIHGQNAITALFGVKVPIITDDLVQMDKGTGAVMCCTFGDETDIKWYKKHNLKLRLILEKYGKIKAFEENGSGTHTSQETVDFGAFKAIYEQISGKKIAEARQIIVDLLKNQGLLLKETQFSHTVKCAERSGTPIEILVQPQWFIKILDKKTQLLEQVKKCNWHPDFMKVRAIQWIENLSWDWCISRQRFFGVPFPVWYSKRQGEEGKILVADINQLPCDPANTLPKGYSQDEVAPETDILDTWATSSISPQLSSHGISSEICFDKARHQKLFPADLRPQAHEIIRTWAFYTIVKAFLHQQEIPWKNLMISGWCLASDKTKMSKSKGNVVTPTSLIEEKGSDAVRYWASTSHLGTDTAYSEDVFKIGQKLITKLFNASKFAAMNFDLLKNENDIEITETADLWILSKMNLVIKNATFWFEKFEYAKAREVIEDFFWNDFCDNYLEIIKVRSYGLNAQKLEGTDFNADQKKSIKNKQLSSVLTLHKILNALLKLFAPFTPHICEEIYSEIFANKTKETDSIHARGNWPQPQDFTYDENAKKIGEETLRVIFEVRKFKSEQNLSMKSDIKLLEIQSEIDLSPISEDLANVCNALEVKLKKGEFKVLVKS